MMIVRTSSCRPISYTEETIPVEATSSLIQIHSSSAINEHETKHAQVIEKKKQALANRQA